MAATSGAAVQIIAFRSLDNSMGTFPMRNLAEAATQTFLQGTPVQMASGFVQACATINSSATAIVAGIATNPAANLTTGGVAKTQNLSYSVPNQPSAVVTPIGAPLNDGTAQFVQATDTVSYLGVVGHSGTAASAVLAQTQVGAIFGLTKDAGNNFWYVDLNITTAVGGACVIILDLIDPIGTLNGKVEFKITEAAMQL